MVDVVEYYNRNIANNSSRFQIEYWSNSLKLVVEVNAWVREIVKLLEVIYQSFFDCFVGGNWCWGIWGKGKAGGVGGGNGALLNR